MKPKEIYYVRWLADAHGVSVDEALMYATRPRRWAGYQPPPPPPILYVDNVVPFPPGSRSRAPEAA